MVNLILALHANRSDTSIFYVPLDSIDSYEEDVFGGTEIHLRGGDVVFAFESPEIVEEIIKRLKDKGKEWEAKE